MDDIMTKQCHIGRTAVAVKQDNEKFNLALYKVPTETNNEDEGWLSAGQQ